jgi:hypothetical protein
LYIYLYFIFLKIKFIEENRVENCVRSICECKQISLLPFTLSSGEHFEFRYQETFTLIYGDSSLLGLTQTLCQKHSPTEHNMNTCICLIFLCPCVISMIFNYNQQDAYIFDYLFLKGSTCFGRFLRPSSGAHNCTFSFRCCQPILKNSCILLVVMKNHTYICVV